MSDASRETALSRGSSGRPPVNVRHGVQLAHGVLLTCTRCPLRERCPDAVEGADCPHEARYVEDRRAALLSLPHIDPAIDGVSVNLLVWAELRLLRWARYLSASGELLPGFPDYLEPQPGEKYVATLFNTWSRLLEKLSVTPATRRALEARGDGGVGAEVAQAFRVLAEREQASAEPPIDADFEAHNEKGDKDECQS
jgi:hypothetical protein